MNKKIKLYSSNWLYNAGVIGLLSVLESNYVDVKNYLKDDGTVEIETSLFQIDNNKKIPDILKFLIEFEVTEEDISYWLNSIDDKQKITNKEKYKEIVDNLGLGYYGYKYIRAYGKFFASNKPFQNLVQENEWYSFKLIKLLNDIPHLENVDSNIICSICNKNKVIINENDKFITRFHKLQIAHLKELGSSFKEFPNSFWAFKESLYICSLCAYLLIHYPYAFIPLSDSSKIFINAPSFKLMYYLNKFVREIFGIKSNKKTDDKREILAISLIEYILRFQSTLNKWIKMNIEIVIRKGDHIEFFSLPYQIINLLSDRKIASILSQIGEFIILNKFLNGKLSELIDLGYKFLKISLKPYNERSRSENDFINENLKLKQNRKNLKLVAELIFKLITYIEEKRREEYYEFAGKI